MAFVRVHGMRLANGSWIENAVFESVQPSLTQEQIDASSLGRTYFDVDKNTLMSIVSDEVGGKVAKPVGSVEYEPNLTSPILSAATSFQSADELLETAILDLQADTATLRTDVDSLQDEVDALQADKGALSFTYQSAAPAAEHTLEHNLDADFIDCSVWTKDPDSGIYALDVVEVTEVDRNTVKVTLSGDYDIKATIRRANATEAPTV